MSSHDARRDREDPELAWRVLGLLNLYRLLVPTFLALTLATAPNDADLGNIWPALLSATIVAMFAAGVASIALLKQRWPGLGAQAYLHVTFDIAAVAALLFSSGGAASGLGLLLIVPVGAICLLVAFRMATVIAAGATLVVLGQQAALTIVGLAAATDFTQAGLLGAVIFIVALAASPLARRLRESEALIRQREIDLANLAQLSQYVVERLRESIVVVDEQDRIRLINESARQILGADGARTGSLLGEISPRLLYLLATWRQHPRRSDNDVGTLLAKDKSSEVHPRFARLGNRWPSPVIIFLEDLSAQSARAQQVKLAALGRLSASIAHEIRNPVGAMSHAAQLLGEATDLAAPDRRLVEIMRGNAARVSAIIENIMQLSRREAVHAERLPLADWLDDFVEEFTTTRELARERLLVELEDEELEVRIDPSHLHQILWNLAENAAKYGLPGPSSVIELRAGRLAGSMRPFLEVADRGPGIEAEAADRIFEPFFTTEAGGTGLGLFISRELAQSNGALLMHESRTDGGSIFRLIFADPARWDSDQP